MKNKLFVITVILIIGVTLVSAHEHDFAETKKLINSKVACNKLTDTQLEAIGEFYMEQMHPGESHEIMHQMMGLKEGSEDEQQFHINMAKAIYCGEENVFGPGGMMGGGMMNMMGMQNPMQTNMMQGMMGNGYGFGYWNFQNLLYTLLLIGLIILVFLGIIKLWKDIVKTKK